MSINDPLGRIEALEHEQQLLKEEVRKLKEQATEPIHVTVERRQTEVEPTQDEQARQIEALMRYSVSAQIDMQKRFDATATQEYIKILENRVMGEIASLRTTQDRQNEMLHEILSRLPKK